MLKENVGLASTIHKIRSTPLAAYARAMRSPVLTSGGKHEKPVGFDSVLDRYRFLSPYAPATPCPVLTGVWCSQSCEGESARGLVGERRLGAQFGGG
eukprot:2931630-Rhodomonas_salina.1